MEKEQIRLLIEEILYDAGVDLDDPEELAEVIVERLDEEGYLKEPDNDGEYVD